MPMHTNYFKIGVFVVIAFVLLVAGVIAFGLSNIFQTQLICETYFDQSVQGLSMGSTVKFRGFNVGQVTKISLSSYNNISGKQLVVVQFYIDPTILVGETDDALEDGREFINKEIVTGLRVFLSMQGVTGVGFLDLDYAANPEEKAANNFHSAEALYIPNAPGRVMEIGESVSQIVKSLETVDFAGISRDLKSILEKTDTLVGHFQKNKVAENTVESLKSIQDAADQISVFAKHLDATIGGAQLRALREDVQKTLEQFRAALKRTEQLLRAPQSNLPSTLENLRVMSENLRELTELLKKYPSQILFGGAPKEVKP